MIRVAHDAAFGSTRTGCGERGIGRLRSGCAEFMAKYPLDARNPNGYHAVEL